MFQRRLQKLQNLIRGQGIDLLFVVDRYNTAYLSGFTGTLSYLLVTPSDVFFLTDGRYYERVKKELPDIFRIQQLERKPWSSIRRLIKDINPATIGFEDTIEYRLYKNLNEIHNRVGLVEANANIEQMRMIKDSHELELIRKAVSLTDRLFEKIVGYIKPGRTERQIRQKIKQLSLQLGADEMAFPPIVASGGFSAIPHHEPSTKRVEEGEFIILDFGVKWCGYCSDMTRTIVLGKATRRQKQLYRIVQDAQKKGLACLRAGISAKEIDSEVRAFLASKGYEKEFMHGLGHSLGLEIHEKPLLNHQSNGKIEPGMVLTVEPGVYIKDFGGVRIEDTVVVNEKGIEILSRIPKNLMEI